MAFIRTRLPRIWLIAALSLRVYSWTTLALISFMYNIKAFSGFFMWVDFFFAAEKKPPFTQHVNSKGKWEGLKSPITSRFNPHRIRTRGNFVEYHWRNIFMIPYILLKITIFPGWSRVHNRMRCLWRDYIVQRTPESHVELRNCALTEYRCCTLSNLMWW